MTQLELDNVVKLHGMWLRDEPGGARADLQGTDLIGVDMTGANLCRAKLRDTKLSGADLSWAYLRGADLIGAKLIGAKLIGADLTGAKLSWANLQGANIKGAQFDVEIEDGLLQRIANLVLSDNAKLAMHRVHICNTKHCIAGWACHLAARGKEMEVQYGWDWAGLRLLGPEAATHFYDSDQNAIAWLRGVVR